jgi:regulator of replication initiation timing
MESMRMGFEKKLDKVYEINDFLTHENRKLKKKLGIKDDEDIIDLDDSEGEGSTDEEREKPIQYGNDEIENIAA